MNNDTVGLGKSEVIASDEGEKSAKILKSWSSNLKHLSSEYSKVAKSCIYTLVKFLILEKLYVLHIFCKLFASYPISRFGVNSYSVALENHSLMQ